VIQNRYRIRRARLESVYFVRGWAAKNLASNLNSTTGGWKHADGNLAIARKYAIFSCK